MTAITTKLFNYYPNLLKDANDPEEKAQVIEIGIAENESVYVYKNIAVAEVKLDLLNEMFKNHKIRPEQLICLN